jgi:hypothetical protein
MGYRPPPPPPIPSDKGKRYEYLGCSIGDDGEIIYPISDMPKPKQNASYGTVTK